MQVKSINQIIYVILSEQCETYVENNTLKIFKSKTMSHCKKTRLKGSVAQQHFNVLFSVVVVMAAAVHIVFQATQSNLSHHAWSQDGALNSQLFIWEPPFFDTFSLKWQIYKDC